MYDSQNIAQRIKIIAKEKSIPVKKMLADIKLGENTLQNMKTSVPKADNLAKIADYLDCSVDYLMGRTNRRETGSSHVTAVVVKGQSTRPGHSMGRKFDPNLQEYILLYRSLSSTDKARVIGFMKKLKQKVPSHV